MPNLRFTFVATAGTVIENGTVTTTAFGLSSLYVQAARY